MAKSVSVSAPVKILSATQAASDIFKHPVQASGRDWGLYRAPRSCGRGVESFRGVPRRDAVKLDPTAFTDMHRTFLQLRAITTSAALGPDQLFASAHGRIVGSFDALDRKIQRLSHAPRYRGPRRPRTSAPRRGRARLAGSHHAPCRVRLQAFGRFCRRHAHAVPLRPQREHPPAPSPYVEVHERNIQIYTRVHQDARTRHG
jgi:hypothetical protein